MREDQIVKLVLFALFILGSVIKKASDASAAKRAMARRPLPPTRPVAVPPPMATLPRAPAGSAASRPPVPPVPVVSPRPAAIPTRSAHAPLPPRPARPAVARLQFRSQTGVGALESPTDAAQAGGTVRHEGLARVLNDRPMLRRAFLLSEVLAPPVTLRRPSAEFDPVVAD